MSLFTYAIEVWACAYDGKYLAQIDKFCKRAEKYGHMNKLITIGDIIRNRDRQLWEKITTKIHCLNDFLPSQRTRQLKNADIILFYPVLKLNVLSELLLTNVFINFYRL